MYFEQIEQGALCSNQITEGPGDRSAMECEHIDIQ